MLHWFSAFMVFFGSWLSGYFIIVTDAWMQHPVAYSILANGQFEVTSFWGLLLIPGRSAICAQHVRSRDYRILRNGGDRSVLHVGWTIPRVRQDLPEAGSDGRLYRVHRS